MYTVYAIRNIRSNKVYIGRSKQVKIRFGQHRSNAMRGLNNYSFYNDYRLEKDRFKFIPIRDFEVLTEAIDFEVESILFWQRLNLSYNQISRSGNQKLTESTVEQIKDDLKCSDISILEISKMYEVSQAAISDINLGRSWFDEETKYPIRSTTTKRKVFKEQDIIEICNLLKDNKLSYKDIASIYGWKSQSTLRKINAGTYSLKVTGFDYPIRKEDLRLRKR
jgi:predicted GIY-YIG superfamily endonuclease